MDDVTPIFGLTKAQLQPIADNIVSGDTVASFDVTIQHQIRGFCGYSAEKVIPTLKYTTQSGRTGNTTIFVKRFHRTGPAEAHHYIRLQKHNAPIPRMYGVLTGPDQREILFLEYLDPIGDVHECEHFLDDLQNCRRILAATAHFNTIRLSEDYATQLPRKDVVRGLTNAISTLGDIWEYAHRGDLGDALKKLCSGSSGRLHHLQSLASELTKPISRMETGLIHSDIYPENTGWRRETGELLILDLEFLGLGPRFYDVAGLLGAPDEIQPHYQERGELAKYYLREYTRCGGTTIPLDEFKREIAILWIARTLGIIWFSLRRALDGQVDWTEDREEGRRFFREALYKTLSVILHLRG